MGLDGLPAVILKKCSADLADAMCPLFQRSLDCYVVPDLWKKATIIPIPKVSCSMSNKDFRPIAHTTNVMKCFERVIVSFLKEQVAPYLDPCQYTYRAGRSTEDAIVSVTHLTNKHLESPAAYARVLFADFSSAFDTLRTNLLTQKLLNLHVNPHMIKWFHSLSTNRPQQVMVNGSLSCTKFRSMGVPQGGLCSPLLFTAYTNEHKAGTQKTHL